MSEIRKGYLYTKEHEWVKVDGDFAFLGITDYAQNELGEIVYVEYEKELEDSLEVGEEFASLDSTKSASPIYSPVNGVVVELNEMIEDDSEIINESPYDDGWIMKVKLSENDFSSLMDSEKYEEFLKTL